MRWEIEAMQETDRGEVVAFVRETTEWAALRAWAFRRPPRTLTVAYLRTDRGEWVRTTDGASAPIALLRALLHFDAQRSAIPRLRRLYPRREE